MPQSFVVLKTYIQVFQLQRRCSSNRVKLSCGEGLWCMPIEKKHYKACYGLKNSATNNFNDENKVGKYLQQQKDHGR